VIDISYGFSPEICSTFEGWLFVKHIVPAKTLAPKLPYQRGNNKGHVRLDRLYDKAVYQKLVQEDDVPTDGSDDDWTCATQL
jgi:hypothetical protein